MNNFLTLSDFEHFREDKRVIFKEEIVASKKFTIVFYQIADNEYWYLPLAKETRGHTFDEDGNLVSGTFEKFFNLNENGFTLQNELDFTNARFFDKVDGSMITSIVIKGKVHLKTKKSFYSDVAI